ncbi:MAG: sulfurtransferase [Gammaproteobacteria bacterium]
MIYTTLIDAATVHAHLHDSEWVVVDCRFNLMDVEAGLRAYRDGHIPGARYAHLDEHLSSPITPASGRHPLPDPARLAQVVGAWGIGEATQVVAYDDGPGQYAARLWWLLRWLGSARCAVLDGGIGAWRAHGYPLTQDLPKPAPRIFPDRHDDRLWLTSEQTRLASERGEPLLVDARAPVRYRGEQEPIYPVAGHVPNAINIPYEENLKNGRFLPAAALRARFQEALGGRAPNDVVHYCGSGVTACHNILAMEAAGLKGSRLYAGSWSEWIRDPARLVAKAG